MEPGHLAPCGSPPASGCGTKRRGTLPAAGRRRAARRSRAAPARPRARRPSSTSPSASTRQEPLPGTPGPDNEANPAWWRESAQAQALASGDISAFHAEVDFAKLQAKTNDDMPGQPTGVPQSGAFDRILASHFADGQGADYATGGCGSSSACIGEMRGQLLPYAIYVPSGAGAGAGLGPDAAAALAVGQLQPVRRHAATSPSSPRAAAGSIVITPSGRGPDGWYYDHAGADTFEVWADVAAHYQLDPAFTDIAGYSMGGYGTYKFTSQFPDLFARAQPTVGPPGLGDLGPARRTAAGRQPVAHRTDARLGAQRPVLDLGRDDRRARADRRRARSRSKSSTSSATATNSTSSRRAST